MLLSEFNRLCYVFTFGCGREGWGVCLLFFPRFSFNFSARAILLLSLTRCLRTPSRAWLTGSDTLGEGSCPSAWWPDCATHHTDTTVRHTTPHYTTAHYTTPNHTTPRHPHHTTNPIAGFGNVREMQHQPPTLADGG